MSTRPANSNEPRPAKRSKPTTTVDATSETGLPDSDTTPQYGSQKYWEERYDKQFQAVQSLESTNTEPTVHDDDSGNDSTTPYHSWYFTYDELRPILLPLLLGGREGARSLLLQFQEGDDDEADDIDDEADELDEKDEDDTAEGTETVSAISEEISTALKDEEDVDDTLDNDDGFEEIDEEDEEDEVETERDGLARLGPISILEIGCGDVPLGAGLAMDLKNLEVTTELSSKSIVVNITCTDYSRIVVDMMQRHYRSHNGPTNQLSTVMEGDAEKAESSSASFVDIGNVPLEFAVADARKLQYADNSFALVLEKGTLDAMLSDTDEGVADCVKIVSECARVASGCIVLISHLNAHTANGESWLEDIVISGLNQQQRSDTTWEIEVHGNAEIDDANKRIPPGSSGPAVYVIHKKPKLKGVDDDANQSQKVSIKFFSY